MKDHTGNKRGFQQLSRAHYGEYVLPLLEIAEQIHIGYYNEHGSGTSGEFCIVWVWVNGNWTPRLKAYEDGWHALSQFEDFLAELSQLDSENPEPERVVMALKRVGIEDMTQTEEPE